MVLVKNIFHPSSKWRLCVRMAGGLFFIRIHPPCQLFLQFPLVVLENKDEEDISYSRTRTHKFEKGSRHLFEETI
jgi:hypothetical protein